MPHHAPNDLAAETKTSLFITSDELISMDDASFLELAKNLALIQVQGNDLDLFGDEVVSRALSGALTISQIAAICGGLRGALKKEVFSSIIALIRSYHHYAQQVWKLIAIDHGFAEPVITLMVATDKNSGNYQCRAEVRLEDGSILSTPVLGGKKKHYAKRNACMRLLAMYLGLSAKEVSSAVASREVAIQDSIGLDKESVGMGGNYKGFLFELCDAVGVVAPIFTAFPKGFPPKQIYVTEVTVRTADNLYSAKGNAYLTKRDAEHSAAKAWISRFHKIPLFSSYPLNVAMHAAQESPVTRLHDMSQRGKVSDLQYVFDEQDGLHVCIVSLNFNGQIISLTRTDTTKKGVKHQLAQAALDAIGITE